MNYRIPEEMSMICFTNGELPKYVSPSITTISQHGKSIGEISARLLIERIEGDKEEARYETKTIKTSLIERESTRPLS
jgi:LacI family transcriptional regulator